MIVIENKKDCCGCSVCAAVCPEHAISMVSDLEGFLYSEIDSSKCIHCNLCDEVCPSTFKPCEPIDEPVCYIVQNRNQGVLKDSTSGGAFSAIAEWVLQKGGVVCGATMSENLIVRHAIATTVEELHCFRNSKYVQSRIDVKVLSELRKVLDEGRYVCFSGTPCQVYAFKCFLGKEYERLVLVDVVCRAVVSPKIFIKYIEYLESILCKKIKNIRFRDKRYGYDWPTVYVETEDGDANYYRGIESDPYLRAFFSNTSVRPSCYACRFRTVDRVSDFTLWDCLRVWRFAKEMDNNQGATRMIVRTAKGKKILDDMEHVLMMKDVDLVFATEDTKELYESPTEAFIRSAFFSDAREMNGKDLFNTYYPKSLKTEFSHTARRFLDRVRLYGAVKKAYTSITHR